MAVRPAFGGEAVRLALSPDGTAVRPALKVDGVAVRPARVCVAVWPATFGTGTKAEEEEAGTRGGAPVKIGGCTLDPSVRAFAKWSIIPCGTTPR